MRMTISYISELLTKDEFLRKVYEKSQSHDSVLAAKSALSNLNYYSKDRYDKQTDEILKDLKAEIGKTQNPVKALRYLNDFALWLSEDHPNILWKTHPNHKGTPLKKKSKSSITSYLSFARRWMKLGGGIKFDDDDFRDYVTIPGVEYDEEAEPLTQKELRIIVDNTPNPTRKTLYMVKKDTGGRILEMVRLKKENFDMTKDPPTVTFPKHIVKGKTSRRVQYLTRETAPRVGILLKNKQPGDLVFSTNPKNDRLARLNEVRAWNNLVQSLGFTAKYQNNRLKKNIHSVRAFCITQCKEATKDADYAHAYGGHKRYLQQYIRLAEERKIQLFRECEPKLSIYETSIVVDSSERMKNLEDKLERFEMLDKILQSVKQPELEKLIESIKEQPNRQFA